MANSSAIPLSTIRMWQKKVGWDLHKVEQEIKAILSDKKETRKANIAMDKKMST